MEGVAVPTAAPHAILGVQSCAAAASPNLCLDHQHLTWGPETAPGPGQSMAVGSQPGGALVPPSPPHSSSALTSLLGTAPCLLCCLSLNLG